MDDPIHRIRQMKRSWWCFVCGWLSLIPVLGLGAAAVALILHRKVALDVYGEWNPAHRYLTAGLCLAGLGVVLSINVVVRVAQRLIEHFSI